MELERRAISWEDVPEAELTVEKRGDGRAVIRGYAIVYNRLSQDLGGFRERIMPGAFDKVLGRQRGRQDLVSYFNHDPNMLLGRESSGMLEVFSDEKGVGYAVTPPLSRADVVELVARRDVKGSSFAFTVASGGESFSSDAAGPIRDVREASGLYEMGPVVSPAYVQTSAQMALRSLKAWQEEQEKVKQVNVVVNLPSSSPIWLRAAAAMWAEVLRNA
jgi:HK97 family phage prohead protease